ITVEDGDLILVYNLYNVVEDEVSGEPIFVWEPLPLTVFDDDLGIFHYKFIYANEVIFFSMDANFDLSTAELEEYYTTDLYFRIVVVPGEIVPPSDGRSLAPVDYSNYEEVVNYYNLDEANVREIPV